MVILIFTNFRAELHTVSEIYELCKSAKIRGTIVDALTPNKELQASLRALIDT